MKTNWVDIALLAPTVITIMLFLLLHFFGEGDAGRGYTVLGSKALGGAIFMYMVSLMITGPIIVVCFFWGMWRIVARSFGS